MHPSDRKGIKLSKRGKYLCGSAIKQEVKKYGGGPFVHVFWLQVAHQTPSTNTCLNQMTFISQIPTKAKLSIKIVNSNSLERSFSFMLHILYAIFYDSFSFFVVFHIFLLFLAQSNPWEFIAYFRCNNIKWNHLLNLDTLLCGTAFEMITHENWIPFGAFLFRHEIDVYFLPFLLLDSRILVSNMTITNTRLKLTKLRNVFR